MAGIASSRKFERYIAPFIFLIPTILGLFVFRLGPVIWALLLSFQRYNPFEGGTWIGLQNFKELLEDREFGQTPCPRAAL